MASSNKFKVTGTNKRTQKPITIEVKAATQEEAEKIVARQCKDVDVTKTEAPAEPAAPVADDR